MMTENMMEINNALTDWCCHAYQFMEKLGLIEDFHEEMLKKMKELGMIFRENIMRGVHIFIKDVSNDYDNFCRFFVQNTNNIDFEDMDEEELKCMADDMSKKYWSETYE